MIQFRLAARGGVKVFECGIVISFSCHQSRPRVIKSLTRLSIAGDRMLCDVGTYIGAFGSKRMPPNFTPILSQTKSAG